MAIRRKPQSPLSPLVLQLEETPALDRVVEAARPIMRAVTGNALVRNALQGRWLGHALHPLLVEVPMGTWMSALALDVSGADEDGRAARFLTGLGILAAVPSAVTGWAELAETGPREQRVGVVHAAGNGVGVVLQVASWNARRQGHRVRALLWSGTAMGVIGGAGFLGGHLAAARKVGSHDVAFDDTGDDLGTDL